MNAGGDFPTRALRSIDANASSTVSGRIAGVTLHNRPQSAHFYRKRAMRKRGDTQQNALCASDMHGVRAQCVSFFWLALPGASK
ncbi:hypothetical protein D3C80_1356030 [compost metagenome]